MSNIRKLLAEAISSGYGEPNSFTDDEGNVTNCTDAKLEEILELFGKYGPFTDAKRGGSDDGCEHWITATGKGGKKYQIALGVIYDEDTDEVIDNEIELFRL